MAVYAIVDVEVTDPEGYAEYRKLTGPSLEKYGGKFIVRGGTTEVLEGDWKPNRLVVIQFETLEEAKRWYNSPEYQTAKAIRLKAARTNFVLVEGV